MRWTLKILSNLLEIITCLEFKIWGVQNWGQNLKKKSRSSKSEFWESKKHSKRWFQHTTDKRARFWMQIRGISGESKKIENNRSKKHAREFRSNKLDEISFRFQNFSKLHVNYDFRVFSIPSLTLVCRKSQLLPLYFNRRTSPMCFRWKQGRSQWRSCSAQCGRCLTCQPRPRSPRRCRVSSTALATTTWPSLRRPTRLVSAILCPSASLWPNSSTSTQGSSFPQRRRSSIRSRLVRRMAPILVKKSSVSASRWGQKIVEKNNDEFCLCEA